MTRTSARWLQIALHVVPGSAVVLAAALALVTRTPNPVGARLFGGPPASDHVAAWRIVVLERDHGQYSALAGLRVRLDARTGAARTTAEGTTDDDGAWEARIALPDASAPEVAVVVTAEPFEQPLVAATIPVRPPAWQSSFRRITQATAGEAKGPIRVSVTASRGAFAAGFPEDVCVHLASADAAEPVAAARVRVSGEGFSADPEGELTANANGDACLRVVPTHHLPAMQVVATTPNGLEGTWDGTLTVTPGSMWVDPSAMARGKLVIRSPVAHRAAYLTIFSEMSRLLATKVKLDSDRHGGAVGEIGMPPLPPGDVWVLASPDPQGQGMEGYHVAWPVHSSGVGLHAGSMPSATIRTPLLADGIPAAVAAVRADERIARTRILALLAAAALVEAVLLFIRSRNAREELEAILSSHADIDEALLHTIAGGARFWLKLVIAAVLIAAMLGALALVVSIRL